MYKLCMRICDLIVIFIEPKVQTITIRKQFFRDRLQYVIGFKKFKVSNPIRAPT